METANVWYVSSFSLDIHFPPPLSDKGLKRLVLTLEKQDISVTKPKSKVEVLSDKTVLAKCTMGKHRLSVPEGHLYRSAWSHKPGKRI